MKNLTLFLPMLLLIACQSNTTSTQPTETVETKPKMEMADPAIKSLFEEVNVVKMHLFATTNPEPNSEDYPYTGKPITGDALAFLNADLQPNEAGGAFACYHTENSNHFILRVPGKSASNSLVLAKWDPASKKLMKIMDLASLECDNGTCQQQDAWLADLDDSRSLELILRQHTITKDGQTSGDSFTVLTDKGDGQFVKTDEKLASLAVKGNYVMQQ